MAMFQSDWDTCKSLAEHLCAQLQMGDGEFDFAQGDMIFSLDKTSTGAVVSFGEDQHLTVYFKKPSKINIPVSWGVALVPSGTGPEVAARCGARVDDICEDNNDQDCLYLLDVTPGPYVPLLVGCSVYLTGKSFPISLDLLQNTIRSIYS